MLAEMLCKTSFRQHLRSCRRHDTAQSTLEPFFQGSGASEKARPPLETAAPNLSVVTVLTPATT